MKLDFSINTENQKDVEEALGILNSLSNDKFSSTSPVVCPDREYICKTNVGIANIIEEDEGIYRILTGSIVAKDTSPSCSAKTKKLREQLISNGTIEIVGDKGIVRKDIGDLLSKSLTASIVTGTNTNGNVRLIEKSPQKISEPTKMARNTYIEHDVLSSESIEDLTLLYNRVYDLLDFIFRDDIPAEMSSLFGNYLEEIVYRFHTTPCQREIPAVETERRRRLRDVTLFESLVTAYAWYIDFVNYLERDNTPKFIYDHFIDYKKWLSPLKECLVLCCNEM